MLAVGRFCAIVVGIVEVATMKGALSARGDGEEGLSTAASLW